MNGGSNPGYIDKIEKMKISRIKQVRIRTGGWSELLTAIYMGAISWIASVTQIHYILFPELGALSHDIIRRPHGTWAKSPGMLILTPLLTGSVGTFLVRNIGSGAVSIVLATAAAIFIIFLLRSPIAPAISAGVLPISLGSTSWRYPASLLVGLVLLAAISLIWRRFVPSPEIKTPTNAAAGFIEEAPHSYAWLPFFMIFLLGTAVLGEMTGWHFILFPPLIVMGFEMFAHSEICPWAKKPLLLPIACTLSALIGAALVMELGVTPLAVIASTACAIALLRILNLHMPPAIAVGLLPFVIPTVDYKFPVSVGIGALTLALIFLAWRGLKNRVFNY